MRIESGRRLDFFKLWGGQTISEIGSRITREGLPLTAVLILGATPAQMGVLAAASSASVLLFGVAAGVIADRFRRKPLMIGADILRALLLATVPLAAHYGVLGFAQLLMIALAAGILTVQFDVAYQAYLPSLLQSEDLFEGNRRLSMSAATAEILGPAMTGTLVQLITAPIAILFDALSFLVSGLSLTWIRTRETPPVPQVHESLRHEAAEGARAILAHPVLRALATRSMVAFFAMGILYPLYVLYAMRTLHLSTALFGVLISLGGAGALTGAFLSTRLTRRFGLGPTFFATALTTAISTLLIPLAAADLRYGALCLGAAQFFGDAAWTIYNVNETTLRQRVVPENVLGRVNAAMQLASRGVLPLGALTGGLIAAHYGVVIALWIAAAGLLLSCLILLPVRSATHESGMEALN